MAEQMKALGMPGYVTGVSEMPCEITPEMQAVIDDNWRALEQMRSTSKSTYLDSPSLREG